MQAFLPALRLTANCVLDRELPAPQLHNAIERFVSATHSWEALADMLYAFSNDIYMIAGYASSNGQMPNAAPASKYSPLCLP